MNIVRKQMQPPRGFVSLEAAAEILWQDETDPDARWGIAFLQIVATTQGEIGNGKNTGLRLDAWRAGPKSPILVRARQVPSLWPAYRWWCGLPVPTDDTAASQKRRLGRPKGSAIAGDEVLVERAIDLLRIGQATSPTDAARIVSVHARGHGTPESKFHRLRKKVLAALKGVRDGGK